MPGLKAADALPDPEALFAPLKDHDRLGLAVSGGADSMALMLLAHRFALGRGEMQRFVVYSVDHKLRPEAAAEAAFVRSTAERMGFVARILRWTGPKPATGLQAAARRERYRLMAEAMREDGATVLLTAHHLGDQAETVLMRMAHGSGIEGLRGMDYSTEIGGLRIIRPLLAVDPVLLRQLVFEAGLEPVTDPSNADRNFERVRWRQLRPELAALGLDAARLGKLASRLRDADQALETSAAAAFAGVARPAGGSGLRLDRAMLTGLPRAIAVRVIGRALGEVGGWQKPHALAAVEALTDRLVHGPIRTTLHGCTVRSDGESIRIERETGRRDAASGRLVEPAGS